MLINLKQCFWNVICPPPGRYVFSPRQLQIMMTFTGNNDVMRWRVPLCDAGVEDADTMFLQVRGCGCPGSAQLVQSQLPPHRFHSDEIVEMVICKRSGQSVIHSQDRYWRSLLPLWSGPPGGIQSKFHQRWWRFEIVGNFDLDDEKWEG